MRPIIHKSALASMLILQLSCGAAPRDSADSDEGKTASDGTNGFAVYDGFEPADLVPQVVKFFGYNSAETNEQWGPPTTITATAIKTCIGGGRRTLTAAHNFTMTWNKFYKNPLGENGEVVPTPFEFHTIDGVEAFPESHESADVAIGALERAVPTGGPALKLPQQLTSEVFETNHLVVGFGADSPGNLGAGTKRAGTMLGYKLGPTTAYFRPVEGRKTHACAGDSGGPYIRGLFIDGIVTNGNVASCDEQTVDDQPITDFAVRGDVIREWHDGFASLCMANFFLGIVRSSYSSNDVVEDTTYGNRINWSATNVNVPSNPTSGFLNASLANAGQGKFQSDFHTSVTLTAVPAPGVSTPYGVIQKHKFVRWETRPDTIELALPSGEFGCPCAGSTRGTCVLEASDSRMHLRVSSCQAVFKELAPAWNFQ